MARPFASLRRAMAVAQPRKMAGTDVKVVLAPGVYREGKLYLDEVNRGRTL